MPVPIVSILEAYSRIEDNMGPIQGVHPAAKAIPIITEEKAPGALLKERNLFSRYNSFILYIPIVCIPNIMINIPDIFLKISRFVSKSLPSEVIDIPISMKIIEKPRTKPKDL